MVVPLPSSFGFGGIPKAYTVNGEDFLGSKGYTLVDWFDPTLEVIAANVVDAWEAWAMKPALIELVRKTNSRTCNLV